MHCDTSLGEQRANLSAFRTFVQFALVWFCRFSLPLGVWEGLRLVWSRGILILCVLLALAKLKYFGDFGGV